MGEFLQVFSDFLENNFVFFFFSITIIFILLDLGLFFLLKRFKISDVDFKNNSSLFFCHILFSIVSWVVIESICGFLLRNNKIAYYLVCYSIFILFNFFVFKLLFESKYKIFDSKLVLKIFSILTFFELIVVFTFLNLTALFLSS